MTETSLTARGPDFEPGTSRVLECAYTYMCGLALLCGLVSRLLFLMGAPCWVIGGEIGRDGRRRRASRRRRRDSHSTGKPPAYRPTHVGNRGRVRGGSSRNTLPMCIHAVRGRGRELLLRIREVPGSFPGRTPANPTPAFRGFLGNSSKWWNGTQIRLLLFTSLPMYYLVIHLRFEAIQSALMTSLNKA